jgi:hypothetical protein
MVFFTFPKFQLANNLHPDLTEDSAQNLVSYCETTRSPGAIITYRKATK